MNTGALATDVTVRYSQAAEALGVGAVMVTALGMGVPTSKVGHYFQAIADAVRVPVMIQDTATNHVPVPLLHAIGKSAGRVRSAKVENSPPAAFTRRARRAAIAWCPAVLAG